ncbi:MAG: Asp-tRNA(Asn)/Glu-tRNA(Gln) amidotransferase subunit GatA [Clostridiales bacterium]|nr:Asp-tRNA(Asn)/Glu-tRNA(Gln) amidotransferase subunit GatA [Clostridiales bacterium]
MNLFDLTIHELREKLEKREITSVQLTKCYLDRIKEVDEKTKAYVTVCGEYALNRAKEIDEKYAKGEKLGPLAGIPIAIKDNICTKGIKTTCSSKMLENFIPPYNATVIEKLNAEDAIILGKLNMDEFAMGASNERSAFFKTKNPWNLNKVPGGSSGGSASCVGANLATATLGSDTGGSIRQPASFCGVVGLKPTYGRVSRYGLVAFASSLDQIGPLTKDVTDSAIMLNAISGKDNMDTTSANVEVKDYTKALINDVKGLKIGVPKEYMGEGISEDVKDAINKAIEVYKSLGATVEECSIPVTKYALPAYYIISGAEASSNLGRFDGIRYGYRTKNYSTLSDIYRNSRSEGFGEEVKRRILTGTYVLSSGYYDAYYKKAQKVRTKVINEYKEMFEKYDVILTPVSPTTAYDLNSKVNNPVEMYLADICTVSVNIAGVPAISVPCGFGKDNMPIGMQLIGKHFDEETILRAAYTYEQNTNWHTMKADI